MIRTTPFFAAGFAALSLALAASAWAQDTVRVRGTIERVDGNHLIVKSRDGTELKIALAEKALIVAIVKASLSDIKQGSFVGVTGCRRPTEANAPSRCTSFRNRCGAPAKGITPGTCGRAPP